jgi:hypothetical protein
MLSIAMLTLWIWFLTNLRLSFQSNNDSSFTHCPLQYGQSVLEVLPGNGWDSLRNIELRRVLNVKYSKCVGTEDGKYLIPDNVEVISDKLTNMDLTSEEFRHYKDYKPLDSE